MISGLTTSARGLLGVEVGVDVPGVVDGVGVGAGEDVAVGVFTGAWVGAAVGDGARVALGLGVAVIVTNMGVRLLGVTVPVSDPVAWASGPWPPLEAHATSAKAVNKTIKIVKSFVFIIALPLF